MIKSLPDCYSVGGLEIFGGPGSGVVSKGFLIELPNLQSAGHAECNQVQDAISSALRHLPEGWNLQVRLTQVPLDQARLLEYRKQTEACDNPASRRLRNGNFVQLQKLLEAGKLRRRQAVVYVSGPAPLVPKPDAKTRVEGGHYSQWLESVNNLFEPFQQSLQQSLQPVGGRVQSLTDVDNAGLWADALNPSFSRRATYDPTATFDPHRSLLDNYFNSELRGLGRHGFSMDGFQHLAITLRRLPTETFPTIIHRLACLPINDVTFVVQLRRLPKDSLIANDQATLDRLNEQLKRKANERQAVTARDLSEKIRRLASGEVAPFEIEIIVVLRAPSEGELLEKAAAVKAAIQSMNGAQYYEATLSATSRELFAKSLPGWTNSRHRGYAHYTEDRAVADLVPLVSSFIGHPGPVQSLFVSSDGSLVNIVNFLGEGENSTAQNTVVLGGTGLGKSLWLLKVQAETDHQFAHTTIIEQGLSQAPYPRSHGVEPHCFRLDGNQTINPFDTDKTPLSSVNRSTLTALIARMCGLPADEDKAQRKKSLIARHVAGLCAEHAEEQLRHWPLEKRNRLLRHALALHRWAVEKRISDFDAFFEFKRLQDTNSMEAEQRMASPSQVELDEFENAHWQEVSDLVFAYFEPEEHLTLSALQEHFDLAEQDREECQILASTLATWCRGGNCGVLFDGATNVATSKRAVEYELGFLGEDANEIKAVVGFILINNFRNRVMAMPRHLKKRFVVEEVSRFLDMPGGEAILRQCFEQFRKFNVIVYIVAQQYSRIADSPIRAAIMGNTRAWIIFNTGDRRDVERLAADLGLSRVAVEAILRFPRPDQQTGVKYSEFLYFHTDTRPICGTVRYYRLPTDTISTTNETSKQTSL